MRFIVTGILTVDYTTIKSVDMAFPELEEYFVYTPKLNQPMSNMGASSDQKGVKFSKDSITYCTSGLVDRNKGSTLSYLHKSIKALNQLRMIKR